MNNPYVFRGRVLNDDDDELSLTFVCFVWIIYMIQRISQFVCVVVNAGMLQCKR